MAYNYADTRAKKDAAIAKHGYGSQAKKPQSKAPVTTQPKAPTNKQVGSSMSADTYKKYEKSYNYYKKTGNYGDTSWMNQKDLDLFNNIRQGKGKSAFSKGTYYYMDNDTYDKYGRSRANWAATGDYGDTSWMNQNDVDAFNAIRGSRSKQDNDFDDFRYSLNDDIIKSVQDKYRSQWGDKYYYDITDMDDVARMNAGQMPKYLAQKYKDDPYDRWLYENNLPSTKDFNDMYSQAVLDYNEQQQKRSGQLQNIIGSLDQFDKQRAAFLQGKAQGKTPEEMLATGDYDAFNAYYKELGKEETNPYKARQNAAGSTDYSAFDKVYDALYSDDPKKLNEALTEDFWNSYSDKEWQKYLNQKLAWNESDNDRQLQIAADQSKRAWNKAKSDYDKQVEKAREEAIAKLTPEQQEALAYDAEQATRDRESLRGDLKRIKAQISGLRSAGWGASSDRVQELQRQYDDISTQIGALDEKASRVQEAQFQLMTPEQQKEFLHEQEVEEARQRQAELTKQLQTAKQQLAGFFKLHGTVGPDSAERVKELEAQIDDINKQLKEANDFVNQDRRDKQQRTMLEADAGLTTEELEAEWTELNAKLAGYRQADGSYRETAESKPLIERRNQLEKSLTLTQTAGRALQKVNQYIEQGGTDEIADVSGWSRKYRNSYKALTGQSKAWLADLPQFATAEEIAAANAAALKGEDAFKDYCDALETVLKSRSALDRTEKAEAYAQQDPTGASFASVGANLLAAVEGAGNILSSIDNGMGNAVDMVYAGYMTSASKTIRNTVSENIILNNSDDSFIPGVSTGEVYSFLYQSGMSMLDSAARIPLGNAGLALAGLSAADSTILDQLENGATTREALALGVVAGFAEVITEKVSLEQLLTAKTSGTLRQFLWETAKQAITEGSEEMASEVINIIAEAIILEDNDFTVDGILKRIGEAGLGGLVSGIGFGAFGQATRVARAGGFGNVRTAQSIAADILGQNGFDSATGKAGEIGKFRAEYTKAVMKAGLSEEARTNCLNLMDQMAADAGFLATPEGYKLAEHLKGIVESESSRAQVRVKNFEAEQARNRQRLSRLYSNLQNLAEQARSMVNDPAGHSKLYREFMEASQEYQEAQQAEQNRQETAEIKLQEAERQTEQKVADAVEKAANDYTQLTASLAEARGADALAALGDQLAKAEAVDSIETDDINSAKAQAMENDDKEAYNLLDELVKVQRSGNEEAKARFADEHADLMNMLVGANNAAQQSVGANNNIQEEMVNANSNGRNGQPAEAAGPEGSEAQLLNNERGRNDGSQAERIDTQGLREREGDNGSRDAGDSGTGPARSWLGVDHTRLFRDVANGYNKDHKLFGKNRVKASDFQILTEPTNERSADILAKTISRNGGESVYLYRSTNPNAPNGFYYKGNIYINDTGDGLVAFYYAHEYAHSNGNDNAIQTAGRRVWQEMQDEGNDALDRYCKKWGEDPDDPKIMNEFIADIRGAYEYAIQNNHAVHDQLELTAEEALRFYKAFAEVDGQSGISGDASQLTDFSNHKIKNAKKADASPLSGGLLSNGEGSLSVSHQRAYVAASQLGIDNIQSLDDDVKQKIVILGDAYDSAKNGTPLSGGRKVVNPDNLEGLLVRSGVLHRSSLDGDSAYWQGKNHTLRLSNHHTKAKNFKTSENLSVTVLSPYKSNGSFEADVNVNAIESVYKIGFLKKNKESFLSLIKDIAKYIATGKYRDTVGAYDYNVSGNPDFVDKTLRKLVKDAGAKHGYSIPAYHGTSRADRVGRVFRADRATSGPMAFFTDSREIAEGYARDKRDTSLAYDDRYQNYHTQFRVNRNGKEMSVSDLWNTLPYSERTRITEKARHITLDDEAENIIVDNNARDGIGNFSYALKEHGNNAIEALIEGWLDDGTLYGEEERFSEVLEKIGITDAKYYDPEARDEKVFDVLLKIQNPFDTSTIDEDFIRGYEEWCEANDRTGIDEQYANADPWDKRRISYDMFAQKMRDNLKDGITTAWTSIPDSMTDYLKSLNHDGIKDAGGKNGGQSHTVWIPFESSQIKSADPRTYDEDGNPIPISRRFNDQEDDFNYSSHKLVNPETVPLIDPDNIERYRSEVDEVFSGDMPSGKKVTMGMPSKVLLDHGVPNTLITMTQSVIRKIAYPEGYMKGKHNLGFSVVKQLPYQLNDPLAITNNTNNHQGREESVVVWTEWEFDGKSVIIPISINRQGAIDLENVITTVFQGRDEYLDQFIKAGVLYTRNNEDIYSLLSNRRHVPDARADDVLTSFLAQRGYDVNNFSSHNLREGTNAIEGAVIRNAREAQDLYNSGESMADYMARTVYNPEVARQLGGIERRNTKAPTGLTRSQRAQMFQWDRERLDNQLRNMKAAERAAVLREREKMQQRQDREKYGNDVVKRSRDLMKWMTAPNVKEGKYVPDVFKEAVNGVLQGIDLGSNERIGGQKVQSWRRNMMTLAATLQQYQAHQEGRMQDGRFEGFELDLPNGFVEDFTDLANSITEEGTNFLQDMDADQLKRLDKSIAIIQSGIRGANRMHANARYATVSDAAESTIQEQEGRRKYKDSGIRAVEAVRSMVNSEMLDLESYAQRLGDAGGSVVREIANGFLKGTTRIKEAQEFFESARENADISKKDVHSWTKNTVTQQLESGETISMTEGQLMNLYALSARQQAMSHILQGGIELAYNKSSKGNQNRAYQLTYGDLDNLFSHLSDKQKRFVADLQRYLSETASGWGNEVSQELYGIDMYGEEFYWPIRSAKAGLATQDPEKMRAFNAIQNSSFTNAVIRNASNPVMLDDCVQTFCDHVAQMANYNGMAVPIGDAMKWFNYKSRSDDGATDWNRSVKRSITDVMGKDGTSYFINLIKDINGLSEGGTGTNLPSALVANTKKAAVAAKIRVMIQQPTAVVRAMSMINPKYFAGFDDLHLKDVVNEMQENAPIAWWKAQGNFDIGTGKSMRDIISGDASAYENFVNATMAGAGAMDDLGWSWIWNAVKREQKARHPGMTDEQLMPAIVDRFTDVINKTQVIDTVVHRSQIMRSKDSAVKQSTAFMSEPIKTFNLLHNALNDVIEGRPGAKKRLGRTAAAVAGSWALNAAVLALHDALKYRDDDDDLWDLIQQYWKDNFVDNFNQLNAIPYIKDVLALAQGEKLERMDMSAIGDLIDSAQAIGKYLSKGETTYTGYGLTRKFMTALGNVFGTPLTGLLADAELVVNAVAPGSVLTKKTKNWDKADVLIEQGISKKQARGLMKNYDSSTNGTKALSILTYDGNKDGKPDFDKQQQDMIAEILGISYSPEKDGSLEEYARKSVDSYLKKKEKELDKGKITEEKYEEYKDFYDYYFELLG